MIAYLKGKIYSIDVDTAIIVAYGVGYQVFHIGLGVEIGDDIELYIFDYIREDKRELFGFKDVQTMKLFERLIDISGVGPKLAQKILRTETSERLQKYILDGDIEFLTTISGVGKKTAQKIILELKGVLVQVSTISQEDSDTIDALISLGYKRKDILEIIKHLKASSPEDRIREALKMFGNS